jgi:hypothetical protein
MTRAFRIGPARRTIALAAIRRAATIRTAAAATQSHSRLRRIGVSGETDSGSSGMLASPAYALSLESMECQTTIRSNLTESTAVALIFTGSVSTILESRTELLAWHTAAVEMSGRG